MDKKTKKKIIDNYNHLFLKYQDKPQAVQWSRRGQLFRFQKLIQVGDLKKRKILDLGCGLGHFYPFLKKNFRTVNYTGIDIVPAFISCAKKKYPRAKFICQDILVKDLNEKFDYVFISGMFNNSMPRATSFLKKITKAAFKCAKIGLAFNFISTQVNSRDSGLAYHEPGEVFDFCRKNLSSKTFVFHHYQRCDVAVFVYH